LKILNYSFLKKKKKKTMKQVEKQNSSLTVVPFWMYWIFAYFPQWVIDILVVYTLKRKNE